MGVTNSYDYIITGSGAAGLSLLVHLLRDPQLSSRRILLVDRERKERNDRTWCFWEEGQGLFEEVVQHRWKDLWFHGEDFSRLLHIHPFQYKLIRGIDFYRYALAVIAGHPNVEHRIADVQETGTDEIGSFARINGEAVHATYVFNSILFNPPVMKEGEIMLLQHFKGWVIETATGRDGHRFDPSTATLMDFRVSQEHGTAFVYVMPLSINRALVEYTLFTPGLLSDELYDAGLRDYLHRFLGITNYVVTETEKNIIPMTNYRFSRGAGSLVNIGTAGGQTRGSSGYTFKFIQEQSAYIVQALKTGRSPIAPRDFREKRFAFYDSVLLDVLHKERVPGDQVFTQLFKKNDPAKVLRFLDKDSSILDDLGIISSLPTWPFLKAATRYL